MRTRTRLNIECCLLYTQGMSTAVVLGSTAVNRPCRWGENENSNLMDDDQFENIPEGCLRTVDAMSSNEANPRTSGHYNTCGTSSEEPVGILTILVIQGKL